VHKTTPINHNYYIHPRGACEILQEQELGLAFLSIPKNASTTIRDNSRNNQDKWDLNQTVWSKLCKRFCVILRDPAERFISAYNMFINAGRGVDLSKRIVRVIKTNEDGSTWLDSTDQHLTPQSSFLIDLNRIVEQTNMPVDYFYMKDSLIDDINEHYQIQLVNHKSNAAPQRVVTAVNPSVMQSVYQADYELINNVNFVNHNF